MCFNYWNYIGTATPAAKHSITSEGQWYFSQLLNHKAGLNVKITYLLLAKLTKYYYNTTKTRSQLSSLHRKESLSLQAKQTESWSPLSAESFKCPVMCVMEGTAFIKMCLTLKCGLHIILHRYKLYIYIHKYIHI